jgi:hypothetical protein
MPLRTILSRAWMPVRTMAVKVFLGRDGSLAQQATSGHQGLLLRATFARGRLIGPLVPRSGSLQLLGFLLDQQLEAHAFLRVVGVLTLEEFAPVICVLRHRKMFDGSSAGAVYPEWVVWAATLF